jgi:signal transduction histidine kinase
MLLLLWLTCVCFSSTSWANDHITARSYWEDKTGQVSFEQAKSAEFTPYTGVLSRGYTRSAIWIQLQIAPPASIQATDKLVLRIRPVYLDEITLFDPLDTSGKLRVVGDTTNYKDEEYKSLTHTFVIPAGEKPRAVWLRLKTTSTSFISVEALTQAEMVDSEYELLLNDFMVLAIVAMFMLLVLVNWFSYRESLYAFFVVRQAYYFLYTASLFGFHRLLLHDVMEAKNLDALYSWIVVVATLTSFGFEWKFLNEYSPPKWVKAMLAGLFIWSVCIIVLMLAGQTSLALKFNMMLNAIGILVLLIVSSIFIDDEKTKLNPVASLVRKKMVVGYYLTINVVLVFTLMPYLGLMKGNEFSVNGLVFYTLSSGLIMTVLMQLRANKLRKAHAGYEQTLLLTQQQMAFEKNRRDEQTHLFHMLMHELKNPLAIIDMALLAKNDLQKTSSYVSRAVNNMKNILERCVRADKLEEGNLEIHNEKIMVNAFIQQLLIEQKYKLDRIKVGTHENVLQIQSDVQYLQIMIGNLLDNALSYGDELVPVEIHTAVNVNEAGKQGVSIVVSNRPGSASWPDPDKVFKKYYRSAGAEAHSGTGLGLYLVRTLANLLGGDCRYVPDDKNIRFELWLPN